jgi:hypothetical protein
MFDQVSLTYHLVSKVLIYRECLYYGHSAYRNQASSAGSTWIFRSNHSIWHMMEVGVLEHDLTSFPSSYQALEFEIANTHLLVFANIMVWLCACIEHICNGIRKMRFYVICVKAPGRLCNVSSVVLRSLSESFRSN